MVPKGVTIATGLVLVALFGLWVVTKPVGIPQPSLSPAPVVTQQPEVAQPVASSSAVASTSASLAKVMVMIGPNGFSPSTITIKAGQTVVWTDSDKVTHSVYSNPHPTHTDYPPLNSVGLIGKGESKSFTFTKPGTYHYHDHLAPELQGTVIVK